MAFSILVIGKDSYFTNGWLFYLLVTTFALFPNLITNVRIYYGCNAIPLKSFLSLGFKKRGNTALYFLFGSIFINH